MKKVLLIFLSFFMIVFSFAQQIVNIVLVSDGVITEDIKKANAFVVVKKYPDCFKRLDYKMHGPLQKLRCYSDSTLTVLNGVYMEYATNGYASTIGYYTDNTKDRNWYSYDQRGRKFLLEKYDKGVLISTENIDTTKKEKEVKDSLKPGDVEAVFKKGAADWVNYLKKNLNSEVSIKSVSGGNVIVRFIVNTEGKCVEVNPDKSVEFVLDEEAIRIVEQSPLWEPAVQEGKKVNAYRRQPIMFVLEY